MYVENVAPVTFTVAPAVPVDPVVPETVFVEPPVLPVFPVPPEQVEARLDPPVVPVPPEPVENDLVFTVIVWE
jgi:hypothetical protein